MKGLLHGGADTVVPKIYPVPTLPEPTDHETQGHTNKYIVTTQAKEKDKVLGVNNTGT